MCSPIARSRMARSPPSRMAKRRSTPAIKMGVTSEVCTGAESGLGEAISRVGELCISWMGSFWKRQQFEGRSVGFESADRGELLEAPRRSPAGDVDDEVDGLGDESPLGGGAALHGELVESGEGGGSGVGVDGGDAARVSSVPGLEGVEGLGTAELADDDAVGSVPEGQADERGER